MQTTSFVAGAAAAVAARAALPHLILIKFKRDLKRLNEGDYEPLLAGYADDAVLHFNDGPHRWAGDFVGKEAIGRFLQDFTNAGLQGELKGLWLSGPPWSMTMVARFDDEAKGPDGERIYANRTVLVLKTRFGKIVKHEDFYEDTGRILELDAKLRELGVQPALTHA